MATNKVKFQVYVGSEVNDDLLILYRVWEIKRRNRGLVPSFSKFIESIMKGYVDGNRGIVDEYRRMRKEFVKSTIIEKSIGIEKSIDV